MVRHGIHDVGGGPRSILCRSGDPGIDSLTAGGGWNQALTGKTSSYYGWNRSRIQPETLRGVANALDSGCSQPTEKWSQNFPAASKPSWPILSSSHQSSNGFTAWWSGW